MRESKTPTKMQAIEPSIIVKIREEYIQGKGSVKELADRYGVNSRPLNVRGTKEGWFEKREQYLHRLAQKHSDKLESEGEEWERIVKETCKEEWSLISASIKGLVGSGDGGIDPETISGYARARKLYDDMNRRSIGILDPAVKLDITSAGKTLGESFGDALAKLRASPLPAPTSEEVDRILECEIVEESDESV